MSSPPTIAFDDRLATLLRIADASPRGQAALWRQLATIVARSGKTMLQADAARALAALSLLRTQVPADARAAAARAIAARCSHAPLAVLFSRDVPQVVTAFFDRLQLAQSDWALVLPDLSPLARSRLRDRRDLPAGVHRALASLAAFDFALPAAEIASAADQTDDLSADAEPAEAVPVGSAIADLVQRIEAYRSRKSANDTGPIADHQRCTFLADADGCIRAVDGLPRAALIGASLADVASPGIAGVDAGVAAAFARRAPILSGRLKIGDGNRPGAVWAIDAEPVFDAPSGRFLGYRGTLSSDLDGAAPADPALPLANRELASAMQQMAHELRSPLNAISGFAELMTGQYFGPVGHNYRALAQRIVDDASSLGRVFDDIDLASRLDTGRFIAAGPTCRLGDLIALDARRADDDVELGVGLADAQRLIGLLLRSDDAADAPAAIHPAAVLVASDRVTLAFDVAPADDDPDAMPVAIAQRLAIALGCSIERSPRKTLVNLPRLMLFPHRADAAAI